MLGFVRAVGVYADIVGLFPGEVREFHAEVVQMQALPPPRRGAWAAVHAHFEVSCHSSICARHWLVKEFDITNEGCPVAQPRFTRRPSASTKIECPSGKVNLSTAA